MERSVPHEQSAFLSLADLDNTHSEIIEQIINARNFISFQITTRFVSQHLDDVYELTRHFEMNQKAFQAQDETLGRLLDWAQT